MVENALQFYYCEVSFDSYHMALQDKHMCTSAHVCMNAEASNQLQPAQFLSTSKKTGFQQTDRVFQVSQKTNLTDSQFLSQKPGK